MGRLKIQGILIEFRKFNKKLLSINRVNINIKIRFKNIYIRFNKIKN